MPFTPNPDVRIDFDQRAPMRDGVLLSADVYRPAHTDERLPVILSRTPYLKATTDALAAGQYFAGHGYVYVAMDVRGRGDSDGVFEPYVNEGRDGYDSIEWCAAQPWSNGAVGTIGGSYPARIQWLAALQQPPHLRAMIAIVPPSDPFVETPTGLPAPQHLCWLHLVSGRVPQPMEAVDWTRIYEHLPVLTMDEMTGRAHPSWREAVAHPQLDAYWEPLCY